MKKLTKQRKARNGFQYEVLEKKELLATATIQDFNGRSNLFIDGTSQNDVVVVDNLGSSQVRVTLDGDTEDFNVSEFDLIRFLGRSGDDQFTNNTNIDSTAFGHNGNDSLQGGGGINRFQGGNGDDTLTGGDRNDLLRGRAGDDTIDGGRRQDRIFGNDGDDIIIGGAGDDFIQGNDGADFVFGSNGDDRITGGEGNDQIETGNGNDVVTFERARSQFTVFGDTEAAVRVRDDAGSDNSDTVVGAEQFVFDDGVTSVNDVLTADRQIVVRPIVAANNNGSNVAESFGNDDQEQEIRLQIEEIFAQADIDLLFTNEVRYNNSFANIGNGGTRPVNDLFEIVGNGDDANVGSSNPMVIDLYFVEIAPGFNNVAENIANGIAVEGESGIAVHVGDQLPGFAGGRELISRVVSHEIAHNLGLGHFTNSNNLLNPTQPGPNLTSGQIATIRNSDLVRNI